MRDKLRVKLLKCKAAQGQHLLLNQLTFSFIALRYHVFETLLFSLAFAYAWHLP